MDKLARLFIHRLQHLARREARRTALRNGLLEARIADVDGHLICCYAPSFDATKLTGNRGRDGAWFRRNFGVWLVAPKENSNPASGTGGDVAATVETVTAPTVSPLVAFPRMRRGVIAQDTVLGKGIDRRAYAVGLVDRATAPALVSHVVAAMVLARAVRSSGRSLREIVHTLIHARPVITLHAPLDGFEREALRR